MKKKKRTTKWIIFARILLILQAISSAIIVGTAVKTKMLPIKYVALASVILVIMELLVFLLIHLWQNKKKIEKSGYFKRGLGTLISILVIAGCLLGTSILSTVMGTLDNITEPKAVVEDKIAIYVLKDDRAESISDAQDYDFAITELYGYEATKEVIDDINKKLGSAINTKKYASAIEMVDALYAGDVKAMILNESYESVITDTEGYEDFTTKTRIIDGYTKTYEVEKTDKSIDVTKKPFIVYISGSDTRSKKLAKSRSDVNILAFVNPTNRQVLLLNTPRDYYVEPSIAQGSKDKLTHCGLYGIDCSMDTLANLYDIEEINYYAQINFTGFETLIDEIGGVTVNSDTAFRSTLYPQYSFSKGENNLSGEKALAFVRERYNLGDGDNARGRHQMEVVSGVINKLTNSTALLTNYSGIMDSLQGMISTDFESDDISTLINMQLSKGGSWDVKTFAVTGEGASKKTYSMPTQRAYVCIPDESSVEHAKQVINRFMNGDKITDEDLQ